jgi:hypothetical protein
VSASELEDPLAPDWAWLTLKPALAQQLYVLFIPTVPDAQNDVGPYVNSIEDPEPPAEDETNPAKTVVPADTVA